MTVPPPVPFTLPFDVQMTVPAATETPRTHPTDELVIVVHGRPKPKGSMRHVGGGRLIEAVAGSGDWRTDMVIAARNAIALSPWPPRYPLDGPVTVEATFTFAKPASAPKTRATWPTTRASGDADKLARNANDALQDAGVVVDDARITELIVRKVYPGQHPDALIIPGVTIRVRG